MRGLELRYLPDLQKYLRNIFSGSNRRAKGVIEPWVGQNGEFCPQRSLPLQRVENAGKRGFGGLFGVKKGGSRSRFRGSSKLSRLWLSCNSKIGPLKLGVDPNSNRFIELQ